MSKKLFYVPLCLVIEAKDSVAAEHRANDIGDTLSREFAGVDGVVSSYGLDMAASPASEKWFDGGIKQVLSDTVPTYVDEVPE